MTFNILDNTTELWMTKYIIGEIFSSDEATLYKNLSDQIVTHYDIFLFFWKAFFAVVLLSKIFFEKCGQ